MLPRQYMDARSYNMLVSVCVAAKDLVAAMHAADMLKSTGRKPDTILYTNLITGGKVVWIAICLSNLSCIYTSMPVD